jgi:hypothetical protein
VYENVIITVSPLAFWNLEHPNYGPSRSPSAIFMDLASVIGNIKYNEFNPN